MCWGAVLTLLFMKWCRSFGRCEPKDAVPGDGTLEASLCAAERPLFSS